MAGTNVDIATGITVVLGTSGFTARIMDVNPSGISRESHDVSHQGTSQPGAGEFGAREFLPADLSDPGELGLELQFNADTIPPIDLPAELVTITWPKSPGDTTAPIWSGQGFFTDYSPGAALDQVMTASVTLKMTGNQTVTVAT